MAGFKELPWAYIVLVLSSTRSHIFSTLNPKSWNLQKGRFLIGEYRYLFYTILLGLSITLTTAFFSEFVELVSTRAHSTLTQLSNFDRCLRDKTYGIIDSEITTRNPHVAGYHY